GRLIPAAAFAILAFSGLPSYAQAPAHPPRASFPSGVIEGRVLDDTQSPVAGAMVSVVGRTTAVATTNREGRYSLRDLPFGPYVPRVHSRGCWQARGRTIQLTSAAVSVPEIQLSRVTDKEKLPSPQAVAQPVLTAAFGGLDSLTSPASAGAGDAAAAAPSDA